LPELPGAGMSLIAADHVCVRFGADEVLHDISLKVRRARS
jgi:ABC-type transporter Mla maintaining outer membrane lipid asymmetry ATPase subunit MlaF